jgi:hypothetical protein
MRLKQTTRPRLGHRELRLRFHKKGSADHHVTVFLGVWRYSRKDDALKANHATATRPPPPPLTGSESTLRLSDTSKSAWTRV